MHCLLCHEKIPRLRVWRTKSEFCCEEHAALYKKQTLERLLVDSNGNHGGAQEGLPEPPEPPDFEVDEELEAREEIERTDGAEKAADRATEKAESPANDDFEFWQRFDKAGEAKEESVELPPPVDDIAAGGMDELWRLSDEVGDRAEGGSGAPPSQQSAEDALAALRDLASQATRGDAEEQGEPRRAVFEMPASSDPAVFEQSFEEDGRIAETARAEATPTETSGGAYAGLPGEAEMAESAPARDAEIAPDPQSGFYGEDPEEDSILDRLMADPLPPLEDERESQKGESLQEADAPPAQPAEAVSAREDNAAGAPGGDAEIDLEAPEPDWDFDADSDELSALKTSLASSGSPPVQVESEADPARDLDVSPEEPDWEELEALDLSEAEIEPPEPDLGEDERQKKVVSFPEPAGEQANEASRREASEHDAAEAASEHASNRPASTRFRPVLALVPLEPDMADWQGAGEPAERAAPENELGVLAAAVEQADCRLPVRPSAIGPRNGAFRGLDSVLRTDASPAAEQGPGAPENAGRPAEIAAPAGQVFLPGCAPGASRTSELTMHDGSVDIEPTAALDGVPTESGPPSSMERAAAPFEPAGLFFDMTGPAGTEESPEGGDEQEEDAAGATAGREAESR